MPLLQGTHPRRYAANAKHNLVARYADADTAYGPRSQTGMEKRRSEREGVVAVALTKAKTK